MSSSWWNLHLVKHNANFTKIQIIRCIDSSILSATLTKLISACPVIKNKPLQLIIGSYLNLPLGYVS